MGRQRKIWVGVAVFFVIALGSGRELRSPSRQTPETPNRISSNSGAETPSSPRRNGREPDLPPSTVRPMFQAHRAAGTDLPDVSRRVVTLTNADGPRATGAHAVEAACPHSLREALEDVRGKQTHESNSEPVDALPLVQAPVRSTGPRSDQWTVWGAGSLENEAEADWIAGRIWEAAEKSTSAV
jgi:hypothetical protein